MTMDIGNSNLNNNNNCEISDLIKMTTKQNIDNESTTTPLIQIKQKSMKRSFDVAFLMLPDDKIKQKTNNLNNIKINHDEDVDVITFDDDDNENTISRNFMLKNFQNQLYQNHLNHSNHRLAPRIYDDPTLLLPSTSNFDRSNSDNELTPRSAFTKVPRTESPSSIPPSSASPDQLSCPSNSPPISLSPPRTNPTTIPSPTISIYNNLRSEYFSGAFQPIHHNTAKFLKHQSHHQLIPFHRNNMNGQTNQSSSSNNNQNQSNNNNLEIPIGGYTTFNTNGISQYHHNGHNPFTIPQQELTGIARNPTAAAILSTLIPPTIASTFSMTAQNVCAKCNINFRMTSDLVYHMRSHHKNDMAGDMIARREREEKLKCPVCNESFRERHHLTRHMTAHQDKDGDDTERISVELNRRQMNLSHHSNRS